MFANISAPFPLHNLITQTIGGGLTITPDVSGGGATFTGVILGESPVNVSFSLSSCLAFSGQDVTYTITSGTPPSGVQLLNSLITISTPTNIDLVTPLYGTFTITATNTYGNSTNIPITFAVPKMTRYMRSFGSMPTTNASTSTNTFSGQTYTVTLSEAPQYGSVGAMFWTGSARSFPGTYVVSGANQFNVYGLSTSTLATNAISYSGMYAQIDLPSPVVINEIGFGNNNGYDQPARWYVLGSDTGASGSWVLLDSVATTTLQNYNSTLGIFRYSFANTTAYSKYRWVLNAISGTVIQQTFNVGKFYFGQVVTS
jgi:hypothetical protein